MKVFLVFCGFSNFELIETLWNVNVAAGHIYKDSGHELIETLWNVNTRRGTIKILYCKN